MRDTQAEIVGKLVVGLVVCTALLVSTLDGLTGTMLFQLCLAGIAAVTGVEALTRYARPSHPDPPPDNP